MIPVASGTAVEFLHVFVTCCKSICGGVKGERNAASEEKKLPKEGARKEGKDECVGGREISNLQEHDFAESTLRIRGILEGIENLLQRYHFPAINAICETPLRHVAKNPQTHLQKPPAL